MKGSVAPTWRDGRGQGCVALRVPHPLCGTVRSPACEAACPTGALAPDERGILVIDDESCTRVRPCADACPYGAIVYAESRGSILEMRSVRRPRGATLRGGLPGGGTDVARGMSMPDGWSGVILDVNLASGAMGQRDTLAYVARLYRRARPGRSIWLGTRYRRGAARTTPENRIIVTTGPLTGPWRPPRGAPSWAASRRAFTHVPGTRIRRWAGGSARR